MKMLGYALIDSADRIFAIVVPEEVNAISDYIAHYCISVFCRM